MLLRRPAAAGCAAGCLELLGPHYTMKSVTGNKFQISSPTDVLTGWSFLTKHARVLLSVVRDPQTRLRDIASAVGLTERRVHTILADLVAAGYVVKIKDGRRNRYEVTVHPSVPDLTARVEPVRELVLQLFPESPS